MKKLVQHLADSLRALYNNQATLVADLRVHLPSMSKDVAETKELVKQIAAQQALILEALTTLLEVNEDRLTNGKGAVLLQLKERLQEARQGDK